jgi:transglutaminase-like putative cysteine protease
MKTSIQLRARLRSLLFGAFVVSSCLAHASLNPYDRQLQTLRAQFRSSDLPGKAVLLARIVELRDFVSDPETVMNAINAFASNLQESPLVRDEARWYLARIAVKERRLPDAASIADGLGFIRDWVLVGRGPCPHARLDSRQRPLASGPLGTVSLHDHPATACVATAVYSASAQNIAVRFGANAPAILSVNGVSSPFLSAREFAFDQHSTGLQLRAGWNTVTLQLGGKQAWKQFAMRFTLPEGGGLSFRTDPSRATRINANPSWVRVTDLLSLAKEKAAQRSAGALDVLAAIEQIRGFSPDLKDLTLAARLQPSSDRWLNVARACLSDYCRLSALKEAVLSDSQNTAALSALGEYELNHANPRKAVELLSQALSRNPQDFVARKYLADAEQADGREEAAAVEYAKLAVSNASPLWLRTELAFHYEDIGEIGNATSLLNDVWDKNFDDTRIRAALRQLAKKREDNDALEMLAQVTATLDPSAPASPSEPARYVTPESANRSIGAAIEETQPEAHADITGGHLIRVADHRTKGTTNDSAYLVNAAQLAAKTQKQPPTEDSNVVVLADVSVEHLRDTGLSTIHTQQVFYINNDRGARDYSTRKISFSSRDQNLTVLAARIYKPDGRVLNAENLGDKPSPDINISMYYDTRSRVLRFPQLAKGDVMELDYRVAPNSNINPYGSYFGTLNTFQTGLPQQLRRYVLIAPTARSLNVLEVRMPTRAQISEAGDETIYRWDLTNVRPLWTEPRGPALTEVSPYVSISTFADWSDFGQWYARFIAPQLRLDEDLRQVLQRITRNATTDRDKIHAIYEFVLRNTYYLAMEFGVYSYRPYPVSEVYARRFGDCKDKTSLMIALLRAAGIDADFALVRTRKLGDVSDRATTISIFNHAIVYIPKYAMWLDGTAEYSGSRELPLDDQGAMALTVGADGDATMRRVPTALPMQNYTHRTVKARIQQDGNIVFSGSAYTRGEDAPGLRREYELADRQKNTLRANLARVYPSVMVDSVHVEGAHDIERDVNVHFSGSLNTFTGKKELALVPSWLPHNYVNSLAPLTSRTQEMQLPSPWTTEEELLFTLPDGATIESLPKDIGYLTPFGTASIHYERHGRELTIVTSVQFRKLRIEPSEYPAFRIFCSNVEKALHQQIKVRLAG